jgi:hypothetical protein
MLILIQESASPELLEELFGTDNWEEIEENGLPELETSHNIRVNIIVNELRRRNSKYNGIYLPVVVKTARKKGPYSEILHSIMKENYE